MPNLKENVLRKSKKKTSARESEVEDEIPEEGTENISEDQQKKARKRVRSSSATGPSLLARIHVPPSPRASSRDPPSSARVSRDSSNSATSASSASSTSSGSGNYISPLLPLPIFMENDLSGKVSEVKELMTKEVGMEFLVRLKKQLRTSGSFTCSAQQLPQNPYLSVFLIQDGFTHLLNHLCFFPSESEPVHTTIISILKDHVLEKKVFEHVVINSREFIGKLLLATKTRYTAAKAGLFSLLVNIVCFAEKMQQKKEIKSLLQHGFSYYRYMTNEPRRFFDLIEALRFEPSAFTQNVILKLVNSFISMEADFFARNFLRAEFLSVGIEKAFSEIDTAGSSSIKEQMDIFMKRMMEDEEDFNKIISEENSHIWSTGKVSKENLRTFMKNVATTISDRVSRNEDFVPIACNLMKNLMCLSVKGFDGISAWILSDHVIQQLASDKTVIKIGRENQPAEPKLDLKKLENSVRDQLSEIFSAGKSRDLEMASNDLSAMIVKLHMELQSEKEKSQQQLRYKYKEIELLRSKMCLLQEKVESLTGQLEDATEKLSHAILRTNLLENCYLTEKAEDEDTEEDQAD